MSCLIIFKSLTYTQSALGLLQRKGVLAHMTKPSTELGQGSCRYAVRIRDADRAQARHILSAYSGAIAGVYQELPGGHYRGVPL